MNRIERDELNHLIHNTAAQYLAERGAMLGGFTGICVYTQINDTATDNMLLHLRTPNMSLVESAGLAKIHNEMNTAEIDDSIRKSISGQ